MIPISRWGAAGEVLEIAELIETSEPFDGVSREGHAIAAGYPQQRGCPDGPLQMHMQLNLRKSHTTDYLVTGYRTTGRPLPVQ